MTEQRRARRSTRTAAGRARNPRLPAPERSLEPGEIEAIARIGSYALDIESGSWSSSPGLDAIFGIDAAYERSVAGWGALIHPDERDDMLAYFADAVIGRGEAFDRVYRIVRPADGEERWVHGRGRLELDAGGRPVAMLGTIHDVTDGKRAQEALLRSEARYEAVLEGALEAILIAEQGSLRFRYANPAASTLLGYSREELLERTIHDIHPPEDLPAVLANLDEVARHGRSVTRATPCRRADGSLVLADIRATTTEIDGIPCLVGFFTDVTEVRRIEARDWLLARAVEQTSDAILITGPTARIEYANPAFARLAGVEPAALAHAATTILGTGEPPERLRSMWRTVQAGRAWSGDLVHRRSDGTALTAEAAVSAVLGHDGTIAGFVAVERDVTAERALQTAHARLAAAVEQASESVVITDAAGTIEYVNPAFERTTGYSAADAVGRNPRILQSGLQSAAFYRGMWHRLTRGKTWSGTLVNRRRDGSLYEEEATISPIRDPAGTITGYVAVQRDVTAIHAAESAMARETRERAALAAALARLGSGAPIEETAAEICTELLAVTGIDVAAIFEFVAPGRAITLASGGPPGLPFATGRPLPAARSAYLYERASKGPWAETWQARPDDGRYGVAIAEAGIRAAAYAPIRRGDTVVGLMAAGTRDAAYAAHLIDHIPIVGEFATAAGGLLGERLEARHFEALGRERIEELIAARGFSPVFQPIIDLASGRPVGHEALTRFDDRTPPDRMFAEAALTGLGPELERACLAAAIDAARGLAPSGWLSLNASPAALLRHGALAPVLARSSRPVVLEITEHVEIDDYAAIREALLALGPTVRLSVDDAGAGFASLRHVVELGPAYIKLDHWLVREVDRDPARQAMIAGLVEFGRRVGSELIAEGIEQPGELAMVRELGVQLGQGYLLGRPAPAPSRRDTGEAPHRAGRKDRRTVMSETPTVAGGRSARTRGSGAR